MTTLAETFHELHRTAKPLRLPNAWDVGSARLMESLGAEAVATTSAGVAWALGHPDGDRLPPREAARIAAAMTRVIKIPLSIDFEGGYSDDPAAVGEHIKPVLDAGAVGINIEDGSAPPERLAAKIERIRRVAAGQGVALFINARTDVYLRGLKPEAERVAEVIARAARYRDAGTDGLFVPGLIDPAQIRAIVEATPLPVNLLAWPGLPPAAELAALGVRRLSAGSGIAQSLWGRAATLAKGFLEDGASGPLGEGAMSFAEINRLFP